MVGFVQPGPGSGRRIYGGTENREYVWDGTGWSDGFVDLSSYLASGWTGTVHGIISGRMVSLSIEAGGPSLPALGSGDPFVNVTNALPDPFKSGGIARPGIATINGFVGHAQVFTNDRVQVKNRTGTNWGTATIGISIQYPSS